MSADWRHSRGRPVDGAGDDRDDQDDEPDAEPGRAEHAEQLEPLERVDDARGQRRVVDRVELVHLVRVVGRRPEREPRQLAQRHPDDREQASTMIWTTAKSTEVSRPQTALPMRVGAGRGSCRRPPRGDGRDGGLPTRWTGVGGRGRVGGARAGGVRRVERGPEVGEEVGLVLEADGDPEEALGDARGRERRGVERAVGRVGGWTTIVWTQPRLAVRSGIVRASKNAGPRPGRRRGRPTASRRRWSRIRSATARWGWLGRPG